MDGFLFALLRLSAATVLSVGAACFDETGTVLLYDPACCCTTGWCGPLDDRMVTEVPGGWQVVVPPGGHVRLNPGTYFVPDDIARVSPDGRWHACGLSFVRCFYKVGGAV